MTLCGELAGKPISAMALIGIGYRSISMSPASIGPVKAMLTELPVGELTAFFEENSRPPARLPCGAAQAFADDARAALQRAFADERAIRASTNRLDRP